MTGQRTRNQSGETKKEMVCGICGYKGRRDNLKKQHFPKKHPGKLYSERNDSKRLDKFFNLPRPSNEDEDVTMDESPEQDDIADPTKILMKTLQPMLKWWSCINDQGGYQFSYFNSQSFDKPCNVVFMKKIGFTRICRKKVLH